MKKIAILCLLYPLFSLWSDNAKLTEGLWYISGLKNSGELNAAPSAVAFRFNPDGTAEMVIDEKLRKDREELRKRYEQAGKEMPEVTYRWELEGNKLKFHWEIPAKKYRWTEIYITDEYPDVLMPQSKTQFVLLARKGARISPQRAQQFWKDLREATRDRFADNLKLPENVPLAEPEKEKVSIHFFNRSHWRDAPENSFQKVVVSSIGKGPKLADDAECRIPALEKLLSSPGSKAVLLQYFACSPDWRLYRRNGKLHAVRCFRRPDGSVAPSMNQYYSHFLPTDANGKQVGDPALMFQFRFDIGLDGTAWNRNALYPRDKTEHRGNTWSTRFLCGGALVDIYDQSQFPGRQMTAAALDFCEKEFARLRENLNDWRKLLPPDSFFGGKTDLVLRDGLQGGIYEAALRCNPGELGTVYLKAFEITKGTPLSEKRLEAASSCISGWSDDPREQFFSTMHFTIYEGEWGQFYGARFEVWFKPDSGGAERKLFEKNYKIQGWQR